MNGIKYTVDITKLPSALVPAVHELTKTLPFSICEEAELKLTAVVSDTNEIVTEGRSCHIKYRTTPVFFKCFSRFMANVDDGGKKVSFDIDFEQLGVMIDCSRNSVLSVEGAKKAIRYLAIMGFDYLMLYTEDTIEIPEYPYFGYLRGRYTQNEIKEIDAYCKLFGIELIACIQTLAHLNQAFLWYQFKEIRDIDDILLIDDEATYEFLDKLVSSCAGSFTSRKIHIGMDEAYKVGLGRYLELHGYKNRFELLFRHLERVTEICEKYGFKTIMWSDMIFRLLYGDYFDYDKDALETNQEHVNIPNSDMSLVYWDYYSLDSKRYDRFLKAHLKFTDNVIFAGGIWVWRGFTPNNAFSMRAAKAALNGARANGITNVFAALWGDDGGECSVLSALPALAFWSDEKYHTGAMKEEFCNMTGIDFDDYLAVDRPARMTGTKMSSAEINPAKYILFQDLLCGMFELNYEHKGADEKFREDSLLLNSIAEKAEGDIKQLFSSHALLCDVLEVKVNLGSRIRTAYKNSNKEILTCLSNEDIPKLISRTEAFYDSYKKTWLMLSKPHGLDMQDLRYGGLIQRFKTVKGYIDCYIRGEISSVPQLDEEILPYSSHGVANEGDYVFAESWIKMYSPNVPFHS